MPTVLDTSRIGFDETTFAEFLASRDEPAWMGEARQAAFEVYQRLLEQQLDPEEFNCVNQATCYLQAEAADALAEASETPIVLESAWRSPAEQYVVMHWNQHGVCGVTKPAKPGSSLFNTGYAVDFGTTTPFNQTLENYGWETDFEYVTTAVYEGLEDWSKPALIAF